MKTKLFFLMIVAVVFCFLGSIVLRAQQVCAPFNQVRETLERTHGETVRFAGRVNDQLMVITASDAGTFTIMVVRSDDLACYIADGTGWAAPEPKKPGIDADG